MTSLRPARPSASNSPSARRRPRTNRPNPAAGRTRQSPPRANKPRSTADDHVVRSLEAALSASQQRGLPAAAGFAELGLPQSMVDVLARAGITTPTAIQILTMPDALAGRDVLGRAQTGSGKTLGFGLPMLTRLSGTSAARRPGRPRGLVLVPTRELAAQVAEALEPIARAVSLQVTTVVGGVSINRQIDRLRQGVDVLVATPGRLLDLMDRTDVHLGAVEIAVLDEADHMADLGFLPAVSRILDATPRNRQCLLFSATLDRGVGTLVTRYLDSPAVHAAGSAATPVTHMDHRVLVVDHEQKVGVAAEIGARPARTLFFVRTKHGADRLARQLTRLGVDSVAVHGNLNQNQRTRALAAFSSGRSRVLVATDVAARGLHIDDLDVVVHFDPPADHKDYLHRSGRTARAGADGTVVSLVEPAQQHAVRALHRAADVSPSSTRVQPGHPAVRELAESGEAIEVAPEAALQTRTKPSGGQRRRGAARRRPR